MCTKTSPCPTIGAAANVALTDAGDNVIIKVAAGTYDETDSIAAGSLHSLSIEGTGASNTIVNGNKTNNTVMAITAGTVSLSGFTIENGGNLNYPNGNPNDGGGISNAGTLTVSDTIFSSDSADGGGAIFNQGSLTVSDTLFSSDSSDGAGGAILNGGSLTLSNSTFSGDTAEYTGGGIANGGQLSADDVSFVGAAVNTGGGAIENGGTATINDSTLSGISPFGTGGAILNGGNLHLNDSTVTDGSANYGGAISNDGSATISSSTLEGNSADYVGGAIYSVGSGSLVIDDSTLTGNFASSGGAFYGGGGTLDLYDSTLSDNSVGGTYKDPSGSVGGALDSYDSAVGMSGSTVSDNTGPQIEIQKGGTLTTAASIIADTPSGGSSVSDCQSTDTLSDLGYNLTDDTTCGLTDVDGRERQPRAGTPEAQRWSDRDATARGDESGGRSDSHGHHVERDRRVSQHRPTWIGPAPTR